ncbi:MAG: hypothetical protein AAB664_04275, partial [Patescibacteria group bacterium]
GKIYLLFGSANSIGKNLYGADVIWTGEFLNDSTIFRAHSANINGDNTDDIIIGVPNNSETNASAGSIYLALGSMNPNGGNISTLTKWTGESINDHAGLYLDSGDINGDGKYEILVGVPEKYNIKKEKNVGTVYLIHGSTNPSGGSLSESNAKWFGTSNNQFGRGCSLKGDVNNDGNKDIAMIAPYYGTKNINSGIIFIYHGLGF